MRYAILLSLFLFCSNALAESDSLNNIKSLKCVFPTISSADWEKDDPKPKIEKQQKLSFHLESIDIANSKARIIGNARAEDLSVIATHESVHFLETTSSGNLNITTVFASCNKEGKFKAVHSRHVTMLGGPLPSQSYGFCQAWQ